jgi:hypothetical protein
MAFQARPNPLTVDVFERQHLDDEAECVSLANYAALRTRTTYHTRQLRHDSGKNPEQALKIQHVPQMRRIPLKKHAENHNSQQNEFLNEVDYNTPFKLISSGNDTGA